VKLERVDLPKRAAFASAPTGTVYFYRRLLFVWPEPFGHVFLKLGPNAWTTSSGKGLDADALVAHLRELEIETLTDAQIAKKLVASEVDADKGEDHHGLFRGVFALDAHWKKKVGAEQVAREKREADIARHDPKRCDGKAHVEQLRALLVGLEYTLAQRDPAYVARKGATKAQLAELKRLVGVALPKDLSALFAWSDGHPSLQMTSIREVPDVLDMPGLAKDELPLFEIGDGDFIVYVTRGPERGRLRTYYNDAEQREPAFDSLVEWAESKVPKEKPSRRRKRA